MSEDEPSNDDEPSVSNLDDAIEVLQEHDPEEVADALDSRVHSVYQEIYDDGHEKGLGEINRKYDKAQSTAEELQEKLEAKEQELEKVREESPDTDELYNQWEEQELRPVKEQLDSLQERVRQSSKEEAKRTVTDYVEDQVGDDFLAETVVEKHRDRIKVDEEGNTEFLRPNGNPVATRSDQDPARLFADQLVEEIPEPYRNQNQQGGPRSTEATNQNGQASHDSDLTRKELAEDPMKMAEFREQYDSSEEFSEALNSLPDE